MAVSLNDLLGGGNPWAGTQRAQAPATDNEIMVEDLPLKKPRGTGLVKKGFFSLGETGGNILGTIGDALLINSGNDAMYAPRVKQADMADALAGFTDDPQRSIQMLNEVDPAAAAELWQQQQEFQSEDAKRQAEIRDKQDEYVNNTHSRALSFIGAATERTYPQLKRMVESMYAERGVDPMFELPDEYDPETLASLATSGIPIGDQRELEEKTRRNQALERMGYIEEFGRNWRESYGERMANTRQTVAEEGKDERLTTSEAGRDRRSKRTGSKPDVKFKRLPDGRRVRVK